MLNSLHKRRSNVNSLENIYEDDVFLIGYPKSGNTWLRFLIGNYITEGRCDFTNSHLIVPGIKENPDICNKLNRPRFMHGHLTTKYFKRLVNANKSYMPRVVFISRDGRDVAVSYYFHLIKHHQISPEMTFNDYLGKFNLGDFFPNQSWGDYSNNWLNLLTSSKSKINYCLLRYEDMKDDVERELTKVIRLSEIMITKEKIRSAGMLSDFESMQKLEANQQDNHERLKNTDKSIKFIRDGTSGQWEKYFDESSLMHFYKIHGDSLQRLGYTF